MKASEATQLVAYKPTCSQTNSDVENALGDLSTSSLKSQVPGGFSLFGQYPAVVGGLVLTETPRLGTYLVEKHDWIRSAGDTQHRLKGLYLTTENFDKFRLSFENEYTAEEFVGKIFRALAVSPLRLADEGVFRFLEETWICKKRMSQQDSNAKSPIIAQICVSYFISTNADIIKELSYLAVAKKLLKTLSEYSRTNERLALGSDQNLPCEKHEHRGAGSATTWAGGNYISFGLRYSRGHILRQITDHNGNAVA